MFKSNKQTLLANSSCEAEFLAAHGAVKELAWALKLISELKLTYEKPTLVIDNTPAIRTIQNGDLNQGLKHLDIKFKYICEKYSEGTFDIKKVSGADQIADFLTKSLTRQSLSHLLKLANIVMKPKTIASCALMCAFAITINLTDGYTRAPWTLYMESENKVDIGSVTWNAGYHHIDYCSLIEGLKDNTATGTDTHAGYERLLGRCEETRNKYYAPAWTRLMSVMETTLHIRLPRCFEPLSAMICGVVGLVSLLTVGSGTAAITYFTHPRSPFYTVPELEDHVNKITKSVQGSLSR